MKRIAASALGVLLLVQSVPVWGATFKDLKDAEWAEPYINKMAEKSIITGFLGEYKPNEPVNKYSAVVMIYRTLKASGKLDTSTVSALVLKHSATITQYKVPAWPDLKEATAFMLENGVIQAEDLKFFMNGDEHINIRRYELCTFLGKALNLYLKENTNTVITLPFKDSSLVTGASAPYVNLLVKKGILNGDLENNFKPYDPINRSAMAKVLSLTLDVLGNTSTTPVTPTPTEPATPTVVTTTKEGTITYLISDSKKIIVADKTDKSKSDIYAITSDVKIYASGVSKEYSYISKDQDVRLTFGDGKLVRIDLGSWTASTTDYTIQKIEDRSGYYLLTVTDKDNKLKTYYTHGTLKTVIINGVSTPITKLQAGDVVQIRVDSNGLVIELNAVSKTRYYEGILKTPVTFSGTPKIVITTDNSQDASLELGTDVSIKRNDKTVMASDLQIGDFIKLRYSSEKVSSIEAYSLSKVTGNGIIDQIVLAQSNKITVRSDEGKSSELTVGPTATITIEGKTSDIYGLRVGYRVDTESEGAVVTKITAKKIEAKSQVGGIVSKVYKDMGLVTIRINTGTETRTQTISFNGSTKVYSSTGGALASWNIDVDKNIYAYGTYLDNYFFAEKIIVLD